MAISRTLLIALSSLVAAGVPRASTAPPAGTTSMYQEERVRVFYELAGPDAVDPADVNQNGVPDQVEDALTQVRAAQILFIDVLGFPDPFASERYSHVSFLDVRYRAKEKLGSNGKAYDEPRRSTRPGDPVGTFHLSIALSTSLKAPGNPTPAHEFFHIVQNGASYFKNRWYMEGAARWSQRPFGPDGPPAKSLGEWPKSPEASAVLFEMAYSAAANFWKPLAERFDADGAFPQSPLLEKLQAMTYVDGTPVLRSTNLPGWRLLRQVLQEVGEADDQAFSSLGHGTWSEENQRSPGNNDFILAAVVRAVEKIVGTRQGQLSLPERLANHAPVE